MHFGPTPTFLTNDKWIAHGRAMLAVILFVLAAPPTAAIVLVHGYPFQQPTSVTPAPIVEA